MAGDATVSSQTLDVDVVIMGGGIAGLWTLARLHQSGYRVLLLESGKLGEGQTRYAQGIIHGGTKYALTGKLTASSEAVADMPSHWRACLEGKGDVDLQDAKLNSDSHYLWSTKSMASKVSGFFASKLMRSRTDELKPVERPGIFQHADFTGQVYQLDEPVFDTLSVLRAIAEPLRKNIIAIDADSLQFENNRISVRDTNQLPVNIEYTKIILTAGRGNLSLLEKLNLNKPEMQLRPLKMVMVRDCIQKKLFAHCMGASVNPRITVTSHEDSNGNIVWYLGGQLAEDGIKKSDNDQIETAKQELLSLFPWLDFKSCQFAVLDIDRAEIKQAGQKRPDTFSLETHGDVLIAWPTKLALAPQLAKTVVEQIQKEVPRTQDEMVYSEWAFPDYADFPWCEEQRWN